MIIKGCTLYSILTYGTGFYRRDGSLRKMMCSVSSLPAEKESPIRRFIECKSIDYRDGQKESWSLQRNFYENSDLPYQIIERGDGVDGWGVGSIAPFLTAANKINEYAKGCQGAARIDYSDKTDPMNPLSDSVYMAKVNRYQSDLEEERNKNVAANKKIELDLLKINTLIFRKSLKSGVSSNCGLVIEVKPPIVKIQTQIGELWIRLDQSYPPDVGCRFVNGVYQPPQISNQ